MKWINIEKAKIEFNAPVFTKDKNGEFGLGRLKKVERDANGLVWTFVMASFGGVEDLTVENITHVAKPK